MITRLTEKIWIVSGGKSPYSPHSLYIHDGGGFLIDAGSDGIEIEELGKEEGIPTVVLSHYHGDHTTFLSTLGDAELWASTVDAPALESLDVLMDQCGVAGTEWDVPSRERNLEMFHFRPRVATRTISDGEELIFGKTRAIAVVAPGHTAGHMCLRFPDDGILFLADYDLSPFGPTYGDKGSSIDDFRRSARLLAEIGEETSVVSHGKPIHQGSISGKMEAYLAVIDRREETLREFLRNPRTKKEIISQRLIYGPGTGGVLFDCGEWLIHSKHLEGMIERGEAAFRDEVYFLT